MVFVSGSLGTALLNTVATAATASFIVANGAAAAQKGLVHGYTQAFTVSAILMLVASAVAFGFISPGKPEEHIAEAAPAVL